ncbi:hypothetical protein EDD11_008457 [Mortierella claussenii]|nr:hypothetical protein EDD11_008457 [Mortierella claussenii]
MLIRGSSPLRPQGTGASSSCTPNSPIRQYAFKNVLTSKNENSCGGDLGEDKGNLSSDDKENKRWYGQEIGLNLWQTTLGAAALLGTGFGSGMVKKVHNNSVQLHPKELIKDKKENTDNAA